MDLVSPTFFFVFEPRNSVYFNFVEYFSYKESLQGLGKEMIMIMAETLLFEFVQQCAFKVQEQLLKRFFYA